MSDRRRKLLLAAALLLPMLAIAGMIMRAELVLKRGTEWAVRISGYDPRDLLRGHYLRYRVDWRMEARDCEGGSCCYCLWNADPRQAPPPEPAVRIISCEDRGPCESWFKASEAEELEKFFIPEGEGERLEQAIRQREAMLLLSVSPRGGVVIKDLLLDRRPWRELAH